MFDAHENTHAPRVNVYPNVLFKSSLLPPQSLLSKSPLYARSLRNESQYPDALFSNEKHLGLELNESVERLSHLIKGWRMQ